MPRIGFDFAWSRPTPAQLKEAGASFVCRYLSNDPSKNISQAEYQALTAVGISVVLNWETTAVRATTGGYAGGVQDANAAVQQAIALGAPADQPIYFSVDQDTTAASVRDYFQGINSVIGVGRTGGYGSYQVIKGLFDGGLISYGWQTIAWSRGRWDERAHIRQIQVNLTVGSADVDLNEAQTDYFGQSPHTTGEFTMDADAKKAFADLADKVGTIGAILEYGDPDPSDKKDDPTHYGFIKLKNDVIQLKADVAAIKAKVGA
jgi:hypothetical protein